jgi:hypothetical protein
LTACIAGREFTGEHIRVRIGINTDLLIAGNVGGGGHQIYTVREHGEPRGPARGALQGAPHLAPSLRDHGEGATSVGHGDDGR